MAIKSLLYKIGWQKMRSLSLNHRNFNVGRVIYKKSSAKATKAAESIGNVPGLSAKVLTETSGPVGPGASKDSKDYKNPEYFCYHAMSYYEAEIEMLKYRCPQPSSKKTN